MEGVVVGAVIGATLQVVLQQLLSLPLDQFKDFKKDLEKLKTSFDLVNDVLYDTDMQNVTDRALKRWMRNLEALAFEADNVLDEIKYHLLSKTKSKNNKVRPFFSTSKNPIANRLRLAAQIRDINNKLEQSIQQATGFGLQARLVGVRTPSDFGSHGSPIMETDSFSFDPVFFGRENDVLSIVEMLVSSSPAERVLSFLPIVGMGGLGKTTLARKVFGDQKIIFHFGDNRVWVHVPRNFDVVVLLKNILTSMTTENVEHGNREALLKKLKNTLGRERYLLVLDDVWNEERDKWDDFVNSLSGVSSAMGNCVVVTTRSHEVASIVSTIGVHKLGGLSADDCWSIIKAKTSSNAVDQYEEIGRNIARKCQGLPLAAKVVGGLLCNKSRDEWISFEKDWFSNFGDENPISKILKLSFDNLSLPLLKKCFAYCSIFPKGYVIEKEKLIQLWMAEGFLLQTDQNNNMESIGSKFFSILLQSSLLQVVKRDYYGSPFLFQTSLTCCNMHDLVHDLARPILCENFQHRYIGYSPSGDIESRSIPKEEARYVRTLFFNGSVSDINFSNFKSLRTLVLLGEEIDNLPTSISELIHLRYLDTSETMIRSFPDTIGELYHLETLRAEKFRVCLKRVPDSFKYLINLRHLHIGNGIRLPPEIGRLTSLQTLEYFHVGEEKGYRISELGSLKNLKGKLDIRKLERVRDKDEALGADLFGKKGILELKFKWTVTEGDEANDESVLEGLQPHPNLKILHIWGFNGRRFPAWTLKMEVQDLMEISLTGCSQVEELPMLGHLLHLKYLRLHNLENVRSIGSSFYNIDNCSRNSRNGDTTIQVFPALERLALYDMPSLTEWAEVELPPPASEGDKNKVLVFPRLEYLRLIGCRKLTSAPSYFPCLKQLKIKEMDSGLPLENICGAKLSCLTHLKISGIKDMECLPDGLFSKNHNMLEFSISDCSNLKSIIAEGGFISLRDLTIDYCKGLTRFPIEMIESCAPSLRRLSLCGLTDIQVGCLSKLPRLKSLKIMNSPRFSTEEIGSLGSLERLFMSPCSSWDDSVSFNLAVDAILQSSRVSLLWLSLHGMSDWEWLPDQIQHLTSLDILFLADFGMESLPEWFGNLSSLKGLEIHNFKKLRHMPSKEAMQRLTKLETLYIDGSPLLLKEMPNKEEKEDPEIVDSEWHKISHIPVIFKRRFPAWTLKMEVQDGQALYSLMEIRLTHCTQVEELPMLGHLPHLKSLRLKRLKNVRSIGSLFYNIDNCSRNSRNGDTTIQVFPALERLDLSDMSSLTEWAEVELPLAASEGDKTQVLVFPRLERLELKGCRKLTSAPSHFPCLKELIISEMDCGLPLENICGSQLSSLTHLYISGIKDLKCLPDGLFSNNHNMLELSVSKCLNLKSITTERHEGGFISLRDLTIHDCKGLTRFPIEMIESCATSLVNLSLCGLMNMQDWCLSKMPRLRSLIITEAPRFSIEEIGSLGNLQTLEMSPCSSWDDNVSFNLAVDAILQSSTVSLRHVYLYGMSHWECLPDQIQHLTSLDTLSLSDFGMEALPEWFGNLSSLEVLYLINFKKLRHMPSKEAMQRLTKLEILGIDGSPLLLKEMPNKEEKEDPEIVDSEWHKISHIPSTYL